MVRTLLQTTKAQCHWGPLGDGAEPPCPTLEDTSHIELSTFKLLELKNLVPQSH